jgi:predicted ferric reductase
MTTGTVPPQPLTPAPLLRAGAGSAVEPAASNDYRQRSRARAARRDWLGIATVSSAAAAVALFLSDGGASQFGSPAAALTSLGIIAGLVATDLVCVMLLLAARLPIVDRTIGHDRALGLHGRLGKPVLYLLLAHGLFLTLGYGVDAGVDPVAETVQLWQGFGDMVWAYIGLALFVVVAVTSLVAVRRKFPYEVWFAIHLLTYAAVAASIPHQFSMGGLFAPGTAQRWYWLALYVFTGSSLLVYRLLVPVLQTLRHDIRVSNVVTEAPGVVSIEMTGRKLDRLEAAGGQFFNWRFLASNQWWHSHPFSLSAGTGHGRIRITVRNLGGGTSRLMDIRPGTRVAIEGPYGIFSEEARSQERVVLVGSGIGIAPIRALLEDLSFRPGNAVVILRASRAEDVFLHSEIADLCQRRGARLHVLAGPRSLDAPSWLPSSAAADGLDLSAFVPSAAGAEIYICGPTAWTDLVATDAADFGFPDDSIHYERFSL